MMSDRDNLQKQLEKESADAAKATEVLGKKAAVESGEAVYGKGGSDPIAAARLERLRIEGKAHELIVAQVQAMDRLSDAEKEILIWELERNRTLEDAKKLEKERADLVERAAKSYEEALKGLQDRAREATGAVDALGLEQEKAIAAQQAADDAAGVSLGESLARTQKLMDAYKEIRKVRGEAAEEELRRAATEAEKATAPRRGVAGTFSAMVERVLSDRGLDNRALRVAAEKTAKNTEDIRQRLDRGLAVVQTFGS
jgi:hypothetical protein